MPDNVKSKEEKRKKQQERKEKMAMNPNSIFWMPFSGAHGYKVAKLLRDIDRDYNWMMKRAGYGVPIEEVKKSKDYIKDTATKIWDKVTEHIQKLHTVSIENIYELNDDLTEKNQKAKIPASICFLPRSIEVGYLGMAVREIEKQGILLQNSDLDRLNRLITDCYQYVCDELTGIYNKIEEVSGKKSDAPNGKTKEKADAVA